MSPDDGSEPHITNMANVIHPNCWTILFMFGMEEGVQGTMSYGHCLDSRFKPQDGQWSRTRLKYMYVCKSLYIYTYICMVGGFNHVSFLRFSQYFGIVGWLTKYVIVHRGWKYQPDVYIHIFWGRKYSKLVCCLSFGSKKYLSLVWLWLQNGASKVKGPYKSHFQKGIKHFG